jgi:hypothetical protein
MLAGLLAALEALGTRNTPNSTSPPEDVRSGQPACQHAVFWGVPSGSSTLTLPLLTHLRCSEQDDKVELIRVSLHHHPTDMVARAQLVHEPAPLSVQQHPASAPQQLGAQRLGGRGEVRGVQETRRVYLR